MPRFYYPYPLSLGAFITLENSTAHHIQVLRLGEGACISLFNGQGGEYTATICHLEKKRVGVEIKAFSAREVELPYALTLAQALPEASKMDWIIEKAVELGVVAIQPLAMQRCVVKLSGERAAKRQVHWQNIIVSAAEQSGRNRLPMLGEVSDFNRWIGQCDLHPRILLTPHADETLFDWARHHPAQSVALIIGPEGGLTEQEEASACAQGARPLSLGARVLRTETAGMVAVASLNAVWGG